MCTLYKGKPNGLALMEYHDSTSQFKSFEGIGVFTDGQLHMGPSTFAQEDSLRRLYSCMLHGRPANTSFFTFLNKNGI